MSTDEITTEHNGRALLRCPKCKTKGQVSYVVTTRLRAYLGRPSSTSKVLIAGRERAISLSGTSLVRELGKACRCPECGDYATAKVVRGVQVENKPCNARCEGAVGPACECECGGENHGGAHPVW